MSWSCGIIGLPNSGKSTIFNALTTLTVPCQPYPFCTIEPNVGIVAVPDERLVRLAEILKPEKVTLTTIEFIDVAGLIKDAHKGEGLGNKFLSHIRNVDAIAHVIRCFSTKNVPHVYSEIDPKRDMEIVETEIIISDLEIVEDRLNKLDRLAKVSKEKGTQERELLLRVKATLERSSFVNMEEFDHSEKEIVNSFNLIATKPIFYVANIDEENLGDLPIAPLEELVRSKGSRLVYICGKLEQDLIDLSMDERKLIHGSLWHDGDVHREGDQGRLRDAWTHHLLHDRGQGDEGLDDPPEHNLREGCRQDTHRHGTGLHQGRGNQCERFCALRVGACSPRKGRPENGRQRVHRERRRYSPYSVQCIAAIADSSKLLAKQNV